MSIRNGIGIVAGLAALALVTPSPALSQAGGVDGRWLPWLGCWEALDREADTDGEMVCVRPWDGGVETLTFADGELVQTGSLVADGVERDVELETCSAQESARFSDDGRRVYLTSDRACDEGRRRSTGIMAFTSPHEWVHVETVDPGDGPVAWTARYVRADEERVAAAGMEAALPDPTRELRMTRASAAAGIRAEDVIEASAHVDAEAVKAWVSVANDRLRLDGETLVEMADAGVAPSVIDVVVAVSYPERFAVDYGVRERDRYGYDRPRHWVRPRGWFGGGWGWSPYTPFYSPFGYSGYGYSPYGYWGGYRGGVIVVQPRDRGGHGRVVPGRGYRRGGSSGGSSPSYRPSGRSGPGSAAPSRGQSTGRKAKPKGKSGGDAGG